MKKLRGETTLNALQQAYMEVTLRAVALQKCEQMDRAEALCPAKQKQEALVLARYYINRAR
jgi:hypothetical protein